MGGCTGAMVTIQKEKFLFFARFSTPPIKNVKKQQAVRNSDHMCDSLSGT